MKKWLIVLVYIGVVLIAFVQREPLLQWIEQGDTAHVPHMFLLAVFFGVIPVLPFVLFAGIMGAKYGLILGGLINWFGAVAAAIVYFLLTRYAFAERSRNMIRDTKGLAQFTHMLETNTFLAVFFARVLPIIPTPVVNIYSAISFMPFGAYLLATVFGLIPSVFIYTFIGEHFFSSMPRMLVGVIFYLTFVFLIFFLYRLWYKAKGKVILD